MFEPLDKDQMRKAGCGAGVPRGWLISAWVLLGLAYALMLFQRGLIDPDEGRYAEIAREMVADGAWQEMRLLGYRYYEKPPFTYWVTALAIAGWGAHDWAVRVPLLGNLILILGLFYGLARRHWSPAVARIALLVLASLAVFFVGSSLLLTDGFLVWWISLTCVLLYRAFQPAIPAGQQRLWLSGAACAAALGFLTKGAVAVVLPALIILVWLLEEGRARALMTPALLLALLILAGLLSPSLLWIERHNPGFWQAFVFDEHIGRFLGSRITQLHAEPSWFFLALLPLLLLPWSLFGVRALRWSFWQRAWQTDPLTRFLLIWSLVVLIFFSLSTGKLISYILPAVPPLGLLLGRWGLAQPRTAEGLDNRLWYLGWFGVWLMVLGVILLLLLSALHLAPAWLHPIKLSGLAWLAPLGLAILLVLWRRAWRHGGGAFLLSATLFSTAALLLSPLAGRDFHLLLHTNSANVYQALAAELQAEDQVVVFGKYRPSLPFYLRRPVYFCYGMNELRPGILRERQRPGYLWTRQAIHHLISLTPGRVYALVDSQDYQPKFLPLQLNFRATALAGDAHTLILELLSAPAD